MAEIGTSAALLLPHIGHDDAMQAFASHRHLQVPKIVRVQRNEEFAACLGSCDLLMVHLRLREIGSRIEGLALLLRVI